MEPASLTEPLTREPLRVSSTSSGATWETAKSHSEPTGAETPHTVPLRCRLLACVRSSVWSCLAKVSARCTWLTSCISKCREVAQYAAFNDYGLFIGILAKTCLYYVDIISTLKLLITYVTSCHPWYVLITVLVFVIAKHLGHEMTDHGAIPLDKHEIVDDLGHGFFWEVILPVRVVIHMVRGFRSEKRWGAMMLEKWDHDSIFASAHRLALMKALALRLEGTMRANAMVRSPVQIVLNTFMILHGDIDSKDMFANLINLATSLFFLAKVYAFTDRDGTVARSKVGVPVVAGNAPLKVIALVGIFRTMEVVAILGTLAIFHEAIVTAFGTLLLAHFAGAFKFVSMIILRVTLCRYYHRHMQISQILTSIAGLNAPIVSLPITVCSMYASPIAHFAMQVVESGASWSVIVGACGGFEVSHCMQGRSSLVWPIFVAVAVCQVSPILCLCSRCLLQGALNEEPPKAVRQGLAAFVAQDSHALPAKLHDERPLLHSYGWAAHHEDEIVNRVDTHLVQHLKGTLNDDDNPTYRWYMDGTYQDDSIRRKTGVVFFYFPEGFDEKFLAFLNCGLPALQVVGFNMCVTSDAALDGWDAAASMPSLRFFLLLDGCTFARQEQSFKRLVKSLPDTVEVVELCKNSVPPATIVGRSFADALPSLKEIHCVGFSPDDVAQLLAGLCGRCMLMPFIICIGGCETAAEKLVGPSHSELAMAKEFDLQGWRYDCDFLEYALSATKVDLEGGYELNSAAAGAKLGAKLPPGLEELDIAWCGATLEALEALACAEPGLRRLRSLRARNNTGLFAASDAGRRLGTALPHNLAYLNVIDCSMISNTGEEEALEKALPETKITCWEPDGCMQS